jgi:hypothetical protein
MLFWPVPALKVTGSSAGEARSGQAAAGRADGSRPRAGR